jgi:Dyp-type peroxidase family
MNAVMNPEPYVTLDVEDIQAAVVHPRPAPYVGTLVLVRIEDRDHGRELLRRLIPHIVPAAGGPHLKCDAWAAVALSFQGLKALGVPDESLASFPEEFRQGMAARADLLGDTGESAPERWEQPLGSADVHIAIYALAPDAQRLHAVMGQARAALADLTGVRPIWQQDVYMRPGERTSFGFKDGISQPGIEGSGVPGTNPHDSPLKAGEFILGHENESGYVAPMPAPDVLGRNGSYVVFRKLHAREAEFQKYLRERAQSRADEELLAAKIVGRWRSGAPLVLSPERDDPELGEDTRRSDAFLYAKEDARGFRCPFGAHARRAYPRDSKILGVPRNHRMIRRGTSYGPPLAEGALEDDGVDRGLLFTCIVGDLARQFEFVQTQWINDGAFMGSPDEVDPLVGPNDGTRRLTIPQEPIRRRLPSLPHFVVNRGGEYCFLPSLTALRFLVDLRT